MWTRRSLLLNLSLAALLSASGSRLAPAAIDESKASLGGGSKRVRIPRTDLTVSRLGYGAGSLIGWDTKPIGKEDIDKAARLIHTACDQGINLFDHADIYAYGKAEAVFGEVLRRSPALREKIVIQSKCGERLGEGPQNASTRVDLSHEYIIGAVERSLKRLGTDRLDILLLHEVDALAEPDEVSQALEKLYRSGKVRHFGVSNHSASQIELLRKSVTRPLVINQIQISLAKPEPIADGLSVTLQTISKVPREELPYGRDAGLLDYCRLNDIQVQAWWPLRTLLNLPSDPSPKLKAITRLLAEISQKRDTTPAVIALAWLLRHPAGIVPIVGTSNPKNLIEDCGSMGFEITREEWYDLLLAAA